MACHSANLQPAEQPPLNQQSGVAFYLITSPTNLGNDPAALDPATVSLAQSPFINYSEIEHYANTNHTFQVNDGAAIKL